MSIGRLIGMQLAIVNSFKLQIQYAQETICCRSSLRIARLSTTARSLKDETKSPGTLADVFNIYDKEDGWDDSTNPPKILTSQKKPMTEKASNALLKKYHTYYDKHELHPFYPIIQWAVSNPPINLRVAKAEVAEKIAHHIRRHRNDQVPLLEVNPAIGLLSKQLLSTGERKLKMIEKDSHFDRYLTKLCAEYNCSWQRYNHMNLQRSCYYGTVPIGDTLDLFAEIQPRSWDDDVVYQMFVASGCDLFLKHLILSITYQQTWFEFGRGEFFLVLPKKVVRRLDGTANRTRMSILNRIYFEFEVLDEIERRAFVPWWNQKHHGMKDLDQTYYLTKLSPRRNLFDVCPSEDLPGLSFFIHQNLTSSKRVLSALEDWIPGCATQIILMRGSSSIEPPNEKSKTGANFNSKSISNNCDCSFLNYFTKFVDLDVSQIITIYCKFKSLPNYRDSRFFSSIPSGFNDNTQNPNQKRMRKRY